MIAQRRIAIVTDDPGWHGARLRDALSARHYGCHYTSLATGHLQLDASPVPVRLAGFDTALPSGVFVRGIPGGSLEQVTLCLGLLHGLKRLGIPVYNDAGAIERTVDKGMTSFILHTHGIPTPPTWVIADRSRALALIQQQLAEGHAMVYKPLFGSQGLGLHLFRSLDDLAHWPDEPGVYYLQRFMDSGTRSHDYRIFVIDGVAVAAMKRCGSTWLNNVHQGAQCEPLTLAHIPELTRLACAAVRVLDMDYAGVDIIQDKTGGFSVLEVNSIPAWKGLQGVTALSIADRLVADFIERRLEKKERDFSRSIP